jgi:hypothetical protein
LTYAKDAATILFFTKRSGKMGTAELEVLLRMCSQNPKHIQPTKDRTRVEIIGALFQEYFVPASCSAKVRSAVEASDRKTPIQSTLNTALLR